MDIEKKFQLALKMNDMDYAKFGRIHGVTKQTISKGIRALKYGYNYSKKFEKIIQEFTDKQMINLRDILNNEKAA